MPLLSHRIKRRAAAFLCVIVLTWVACPIAALSSGIQESDEFRFVADVVERNIERFGADNVLLVIDIDNTLLAMNQPLGSDQWFEWQKFLLENDTKSKYLVADDFAGLLEAQGLLYNLGRMHPPQQNLPRMIRQLQRRGIHTLVLTSRGPEFRVATERELRHAGYDFADTALRVRGVPRGDYLPYNLEDLDDSGLKKQDVKAFRLEEPRPVTYANGVFMTAGQPKGAMLLTMLHHARPKVKGIVYCDDNMRHVAYVFAAAASRNKNITAIHYTREDENVQRFQYGEKKDVHRSWRKLTRTLDEVFN